MPISAILLLLLVFVLLGLTLPLALNGDSDSDSGRRSTLRVALHEGSLDPVKPLATEGEWGFCQISAYSPTIRASVMSLALGYEDALLPSSVSQSPPLSSLQSSAPGLFGQSEYMIGDVAVTVIFAESDNTTDTESETWDDTRIDACIAEITEGLLWWELEEPLANLSFHINSYGTQATGYEPITRPHDDEGLWIAEIMEGLGYPSDNGTYLDQVATLNAYEMSQQGTDWAFTIFVVDSLNDVDGSFSDGWFAYSWTGGPFTVLTYDNNDYGIDSMDWVCAHETGHIFWATDEYDGIPEESGYLNVLDDEGADCIMSYPYNWNLCPASRGQIGWRDTDSDNILDSVDTTPDTIFDPAPPDFTSDTVLVYTGKAEEVPLANNNPQWWSSGNDISINTITDVQYRVDDGDWLGATAADGEFDEGVETFTFTTPSLSPGPHTIEARAQNSAGNWETSYVQHSVVVDTTDPIVDMNDIQDFVSALSWIGGIANDAPPGQLDRVEIQIRDVGQDTYWDGTSWVPALTWIVASGTDSWSYALPPLNNRSTYEVKAMAIDRAGNESATTSDTFTIDTTVPTITMHDISDPVDSLSSIGGTADDVPPGQVDRVEVQIRNVTQNTYWDEANWVPAPTWINASGTNAWSRALPSLTNGYTYEVKAMAIDRAGNASTEASDIFTFDDLTSPTVTMISLPDFVSALSWISGTATDAPPGQLDRVDIQIRDVSQNAYWDGASWAPASTWITASGTDSWSYVLPSLKNGSVYEIGAIAIDSAQNESAVVSDTFIFDPSIPTVTMNDISDPVSSLSSIDGTAADAPPGQLDRVEIQIRNLSQGTYWDGSYWWTITPTWISASGTESWSYALPSLHNATYVVSARAVDRAGNESAVVSDTFTFDPSIPTITINDISNPVNSLSSIGGTAADAPPGQLDRVEIQIKNASQNTYWDGSSWMPASTWITASGTDSWSYTLPSLDNATYEVKAMAIDTVGNESAVAADTFTFDSAIPTVTINDISNPVNSLSSIGGTAADTSPGQLDRVEVQIKNSSQNTYWDGTSWVSASTWITASGTDSWSYDLPSLDDGSTYEVKAMAIDTVGNESAVAADTFTFDTAIPTVTMNDISDPVSSLSSIGGTAADAPPGQLDRVEVQIKNISQNTYWDGSSWAPASTWISASGTDSWSYALPSLDNATYEVRAKAIDRAGNESAVASDTFTIDTGLPLWIWIVIGLGIALFAAILVLIIIPRLIAGRASINST